MDLNSDLGELSGPEHEAVELAVLRAVTTAHVACGGHAGDLGSMHRTVAAAVTAGVVVGAHPSYPDRDGFGRRPVPMSVAALAETVVTQVDALRQVAREEGTAVRSVKPHGALYHRIGTDEDAAECVARAVRELSGDLALVLASGSRGLDVARDAGLAAVAEGFCDRAYLPDGSLAPRSEVGAVDTDPESVSRRAVTIARTRRVEALGGAVVRVECDTLCVHGDTPGAAELAAAVRTALEESGIAVEPAVGVVPAWRGGAGTPSAPGRRRGPTDVPR